MSKVRRTERGWAGHFCAAQYCQFRRNTLLEYGDIKIVVSTVGNYQPPSLQETENKSKREWQQQIGFDRYYETMAFHSKDYDFYYHDADVNKEINFYSNWQIRILNEKSDKPANEMHENVVKEITERLLSGDKFEIKGEKI